MLIIHRSNCCERQDDKPTLSSQGIDENLAHQVQQLSTARCANYAFLPDDGHGDGVRARGKTALARLANDKKMR